MRFVIQGFVLFALLLLGAHSLRWGDTPQTALWCLLGGLVFVRQTWCRYVLVVVLAYGAWQWWGTTTTLVQMRLAMEEPWLRLAGIMGGVFLLTLSSAFLLLSAAAKRYFAAGEDKAGAQAMAFMLTFAILTVARDKAPLPLLLADRFFPGWGLFQTGCLALYAAFLSGALLDPARHKRLRPILWGGFSLVFFLQLALGVSGLEQLLMTGKLHLPVPALVIGGPLYRGGGFFMPILFGVTVLLVGPAWCSHLCYIGAWDDMCSRSGGGSRGVQQPERPPWRGRVVALVLTIVLAVVLRISGAPLAVAVFLAVGFGLGGVAVMVFVSRKKGRMMHCTLWCPLGVVANFMGKLTPWRMRIGEGCTKCGKCGTVCRYGALRKEDLAAGRPGISCTLCGDCIPFCKHGQLGYSFARVPQHLVRPLFICLATSLHAVFLAIARI